MVMSSIFFSALVHFRRVGPSRTISSTGIQIRQEGRLSDPIRTRPMPNLGFNPTSVRVHHTHKGRSSSAVKNI
jgi:hypothetical protein